MLNGYCTLHEVDSDTVESRPGTEAAVAKARSLRAQNLGEAFRHYKTAESLLSCAMFKVGEIVSVEFSHVGSNGVVWFNVTGASDGENTRKFDRPVAYPAHHLTRFTF